MNGACVTKRGKSKACMSIDHSTFLCSKRYYKMQIIPQLSFLFIALKTVKLKPDLLKVIFFARSGFSLIKFCAELCTEIAIKHIRFEKIWSNCHKNKKKCLFCKFPVQKFIFCADSRKFLCGHASACPCVLEALD